MFILYKDLKRFKYDSNFDSEQRALVKYWQCEALNEERRSWNGLFVINKENANGILATNFLQ